MDEVSMLPTCLASITSVKVEAKYDEIEEVAVEILRMACEQGKTVTSPMLRQLCSTPKHNELYSTARCRTFKLCTEKASTIT